MTPEMKITAIAGYYVETWDHDAGCFTPQIGVPTGPHSRWGLRGALRQLQRLGYETRRAGAYSVLVEKRGMNINGPSLTQKD